MKWIFVTLKLTDGIKADCVLHSNLTISKRGIKLDKILIIENVEKILVVSFFQNINNNFMSAKKRATEADRKMIKKTPTKDSAYTYG